MKEGRTVIVEQDYCTSRMDIKIESNVLCTYGTGVLVSDGRDVATTVPIDICKRRFNLDEDDKEEVRGVNAVNILLLYSISSLTGKLSIKCLCR